MTESITSPAISVVVPVFNEEENMSILQAELRTALAKLDHEIISTLTPAPELFVQATRVQTPAVLCQPESLTARQITKLVDFFTEREALPR